MVARRLSAILAADVVGYSRLIRADEEGTLAALKGIREDIIDPKIAEHHGRVVKLMGDGMLAEFGSVVDAVRNAVAMQQAVAEHQAEVPEDRRIVFRVGVNLGDVVIEGDDIHGDGVNVAARLEGLADPGGICVSGAVHEQVRDRIDLTFEDLGEQEVKNIDRPIRVWRWASDTSATASGPAPTTKPLPLPDKPSIAVLPFDNMSGDPEQEYFSDGITEDIITDLSKVSGLFVIARNSSFAYKGANPDVAEVSRALGVRHIVEGSVRKAGNRVRITAQLIDGTTGGHIWAERYDRDLTDIFAVQDEVTREIVGALEVKLTADEKARLAGRGKIVPEAYDYFVRARDRGNQLTRDAIGEARAMFERAIEIDPDFAAAYAGLSWAIITEYVNGWRGGLEDELVQGVDLARKAVALDPYEPFAHFALSNAETWRRNFDAAERAAERAVALDPNSAFGQGTLGRARHFAGRPAEAITAFETGMRLDPHFPDIGLHFLAQAQFSLKRWDEAEANFKRRVLLNPRTDESWAYLASLYGHTGRAEEARAMWEEVMRVNPDYSIERMRRILPYKNPEQFEFFVDGLRKAGLPE
jgi:adenylate cyclase